MSDATTNSPIAAVRVDMRINREFDYRIPPELAGRVAAGSRVRVPFGSRQILGTVILLRDPDPSTGELKSVLEVIGASTLLTPPLLRLAQWMAEYYLCPLDLVLRSVSPAIVQKRSAMRHVKKTCRHRTR